MGWLREATQRSRGDVLDVGCSYGDHLFMLNAALGKPQNVNLVGVDLHKVAVERANDFAARIPGFSNCNFEVADLARGLPFKDGQFTAANLADVLEHMENPRAALREIARVIAPGGTLVISTPLRDGIAKRAAAAANQLTRQRLYRSYYTGKDARIDSEGRPIMEVIAGNDHVSEMTLPELLAVCVGAGFTVEHVEPMAILSGSRWFDRHTVTLAALLFVEAAQTRLRRPAWAHSVMLRLRRA